jgi:hypothetical protein
VPSLTVSTQETPFVVREVRLLNVRSRLMSENIMASETASGMRMADQASWESFASRTPWESFAPRGASVEKRRRVRRSLALGIPTFVTLAAVVALLLPSSTGRPVNKERQSLMILGGRHSVTEYGTLSTNRLELLGLRVRGPEPVTITGVTYAVSGPLAVSTTVVVPAKSNSWTGFSCCGYGPTPTSQYLPQRSAVGYVLEPHRTYGLVETLRLRLQDGGTATVAGITRAITLTYTVSGRVFTLPAGLRMGLCQGMSDDGCDNAMTLLLRMHSARA